MINKEKINNTINKLLDVIHCLNSLTKDELHYLQNIVEIKLKIDESEEIEKG